MQLKMMKLSGFKSFVDPVSITFPSQLISIVGPNGCGKSNIIDAVRWVLGESSAKNLRGDAMTDVIFNGASSRKAVGQASVELRFDNQMGKLGGHFNPYQEIAIKRMVTRAGESSYFLNGKRCRKRDITDLFLGTGAGSKGYSIISQGTISQLIEARPLTLRAYIEEAAGISIYKERRRETLQRIQQTNTNLEQIQLMLTNLDQQVERLEKQAESAARFHELKQALRQVEIKMAASAWQQHQTSYQALTQSLENLNKLLYDNKLKQQEMVEKHRQAQLDLENKHQAYSTQQQAYFEKQSQLVRLEEQASLFDKEHRHLEQQIRETEHSLHSINQTIQDEQDKISQLKQTHQQLVQTLTKEQHDYEHAHRSFSQLWQQHQQHLQQKQELAQQHQSLNHRQQLCQLKLDQLQDKHQQWMSQLDQSDLQVFNNTIAEGEAQSRILEEKSEQHRKRIADLTASIACLRASIDQEKHQTTTLKNKIHTAEKEYQSVLSEKTIVDASITANSNLNQPNKPAFLANTAPVFQALSVAEDWQACVQWFMPQLLNAYLIDPIDQVFAYQEQLGNSGLLLAQTKTYTTQMEQTNLTSIIQGNMPDTPIDLEAILIAESVTEAIKQRASLKSGQSILCKDGFWLGKTWLQCMPAREEKQINLLAYAEQQKALAVQLQTLSDDIAMLLQQQDNVLEKISELNSRLNQDQVDLQHIQSEQKETDIDIKLNQNKIDHAQHEKVKLESLYEQCQFELEAIATDKLQLESDLASIGSEKTLLESKQAPLANLDADSESMQDQQKAIDAQAKVLQEKALEQKQIEQSLLNSNQQINYWQTQKTTLAARLSELNQQLQQKDHDHLAQHGQSIEQLKSEQIDGKANLDSLSEAIEEQRATIDQSQQQLNTMAKTIEEVEKQFQHKQLKQHETSVRVESAKSQLEQWQLTPDDISQYVEDETMMPTLAQQLKQFQAQIESLGGVNLAAQSELETERTRQQTLASQRDDLINAIEALNRAIAKIDQDTKTRFVETFDTINASFQTLFPTVFGGGKASLALDGQDWLESGVVVMAQPPGKRNSTIHLLSGGEKALTAVALVFALFQLNPSPFCLLDEVDAPLDDTNVSRFCDLVKSMSEQVQFIIITHNKVTMTLAEQLIGVTMREPGVSRLVAVDVAQAMDLCES